MDENSEDQDITKLPLNPEVRKRAFEVARRYMDSMDLGFDVSYGDVRPSAVSLKTEGKPEDGVVGREYRVPVKVTVNGTEIEFELPVDGQDFEVKRRRYDVEAGKSWDEPGPTKRQIFAVIDGRRQHYVVVAVKNGDAARRLTRHLFADDDVVAVGVGPKNRLEDIVYYINDANIPEEYKEDQFKITDTNLPKILVSPSEEVRRQVLRGSQFHSIE